MRLLAGACAVAMVLGAAGEARAQIGRVAGTVAGEDGRPIKGATIRAENPAVNPATFLATSDDRGRFAILGFRRGPWLFTIEAPGYEPHAVRVDVSTSRPNPPLAIRLAQGPAPAPRSALSGLSAKEVQQRLDAAAALVSAGDHRAAVKAYREILERIPALTSVHLELGALHERLNDPASALAEYRRLAELEPDNTAVRAAIARLAGR